MMDKIIREEARLIILKQLTAEIGNRLNSELIRLSLETFGITKTRDWVNAELRWLENVGAVNLVEAGTVLVAELTARGEDHVTRRSAIDGVKRPGPPR